MELSELIARTKLWVNFNSGQDDQDFSEETILGAINMAYKKEVTLAKQEGSQRWFHMTQEPAVWLSGEVTYTVPSPLNRVAVLRIADVTEEISSGTPLLWGEGGSMSQVFWKNHKTLQWGTTGPTQDTTLRFMYVASPEELVNDDDYPELVPEEFHELLPLSAACILRLMADEICPVSWTTEQNEQRQLFWKFVSRGRPLADLSSSNWLDVPDAGAAVADQDGQSISADNNT
jgi:hypothetical protein